MSSNVGDNNLMKEKRDYLRKLNVFFNSIGDQDEKCRAIVDIVRSAFSSTSDLIVICNNTIETIEHLIRMAVEVSERVLLYRIKGDFYRYKWKVNNDDVNAGDEATKAYDEAFCMCQWNFEPTATCLLRLAVDYAVHLNDMDNPDLASTVLKRVVNCARQCLQDENEMNATVANKSQVESLLIDLNTRSERFEAIADGKRLRL